MLPEHVRQILETRDGSSKVVILNNGAAYPVRSPEHWSATGTLELALAQGTVYIAYHNIAAIRCSPLEGDVS